MTHRWSDDWTLWFLVKIVATAALGMLVVATFTEDPAAGVVVVVVAVVAFVAYRIDRRRLRR